jgi:hypothetical protein
MFHDHYLTFYNRILEKNVDMNGLGRDCDLCIFYNYIDNHLFVLYSCNNCV